MRLTVTSSIWQVLLLVGGIATLVGGVWWCVLIGPSESILPSAGWLAALFLALVGAALVLTTPFVLRARWRDRYLRAQNPSAYVVGVMTSSIFNEATDELGWPRMTGTLSVCSTDDGLQFWGFSVPKPQLLRSLRWSEVGPITVDQTGVGKGGTGARATCIDVPVRADSTAVLRLLPLGITMSVVAAPGAKQVAILVEGLERNRTA